MEKGLWRVELGCIVKFFNNDIMDNILAKSSKKEEI